LGVVTLGTLPPGWVSRGRQFCFAVVLGGALLGCGHGGDSRDERGAERTLVSLLEADQAAGAFDGLLKPIAIRADPFGRVFVADAGDRTIKVFDSLGIPLFQFGGAGAGPGELPDVQDVLPGERSILVHLGASRRVAVYDTAGRFRSVGSVLWPEDSYSRLGDSQLVTAADPAWARPSDPRDTNAPPLFAIAGLTSGVRRGIGLGDRSGTPFARHVRNYALLGGTSDGAGVWLAMLNDPRVGYYDAATGRLRIWERTVPFTWRAIRLDYVPQRHFPKRGGLPLPPFDPVTLSVAVDSNDRFFMLTALGTIDNSEVAPSRLALDVVRSDAPGFTRHLIRGAATHLAVSPSGSLVYLLDARSATVHVARGPDLAGGEH
jgi:hypothetical protein